MARLSQLLGNRELAFEDNLEKGRIWAYTDGNMYSGFCNGFCWRAPAVGKAIIEVWGAAGSGAQMCCCGAGLPGNAPAYVKKCICVCPGNYVCGYIGRSCNNSSSLCFRGCSEATCVRWTGCSHYNLFNGGVLPNQTVSHKANNLFGGWGAAPDPVGFQSAVPVDGQNVGFTGGNPDCVNKPGQNCCCHYTQCCIAGKNGGTFTEGCLCAQGGRGGVSFCMDTKSPYSCFLTGYFCGSRVGPGHNMCDTGNSACGIVCNWCQGPGFIACGYGGDLNCCGHFSCVSFQACLQTCPCQYQQHASTAAGVYNEDGGVMTYTVDNDSPMTGWSGAAVPNQMNALKTMSRWPSHQEHFTCWNNQRGCGCYEMQGCMNYMPYGVPGSPPFPCPGVRDHAGRGGMGSVRIKFIPNEGESAY
jgi:hypothetical protein